MIGAGTARRSFDSPGSAGRRHGSRRFQSATRDQQIVHLIGDDAPRRSRCFSARNDHDLLIGAQGPVPQDLTKAAAEAVAGNRGTKPFSHHEPYAGWTIRGSSIKDEKVDGIPPTFRIDLSKLVGVTQRLQPARG